jgi:hypothetical protein
MVLSEGYEPKTNFPNMSVSMPLNRILKSASGHGRFWKASAKTIRFAKQGCTNRPFYQIVVMEVRSRRFKFGLILNFQFQAPETTTGFSD